MTRILTVLVISLGWGGSLSATTLFEEDFNYAGDDLDNQELHSQSGGAGFAGAWAATTNLTQLTSTTFDYTVAGGATIEGGNGALDVGGGNGDDVINRELATPYDGDEFFVRFLLHKSGGTNDDQDRFAFWVSDVSEDTPNGHNGPYVAQHIVDAQAGNDFRARLQASSGAIGGPDAQEQETYLVVARFSKSESGPGNRYDQVALWINPAADDLDSPEASLFYPTASAHSVSRITQVGMQTVNLDADDEFIFDSLKAGTQWGDVVPVPEPASIGLLGVGCCAMLARRRRP